MEGVVIEDGERGRKEGRTIEEEGKHDRVGGDRRSESGDPESSPKRINLCLSSLCAKKPDNAEAGTSFTRTVRLPTPCQYSRVQSPNSRPDRSPTFCTKGPVAYHICSTPTRLFSSSMDSHIPRILSFWFDHPEPIPRWFRQSDDLDNQIRDQFGGLVTQARSNTLDGWAQEPDGALAMLILLDQFPRNIFRGSADSYSSDAKARNVTIRAVARGFDRQVPSIRQPFFYLPLMHQEDLLSQIASKALYEGCTLRCGADEVAKDFAEAGVGFGSRHLDVIARLGRYPSRNKALGRESTKEEETFLKEHPLGFDMGSGTA